MLQRQPPPDEPTLDWLLWLLVVIVAGGLLVALVLMLARRRSGRGGKGASGGGLPVAVSPAERTRLAAILSQPNLGSRDAIVAAYRSYLAWSAEKGLARLETEAPHEHGRRVAASIGWGEDLVAFVDAYQVARLADREPTKGERQTAETFAKSRLAGGA